MANRFMAGFDDHDLTTMAYEWQLVNSSGISIVSGRVGNCLRLSTYNTQAVVTCCPDGQQTVTIGFAVRFADVSAFGDVGFCLLGDTAVTHLILRLLNGGNIGVYRANAGLNNFDPSASTLLATSTTVAVANTWLYIELQATIDDAAGVLKIRFQGASSDEISLTSHDTRNGSTALVTRLGFSGFRNGMTNNPVNVDIDDMWVNDANGSDCTGFLGDMRVDFHLPVSDGADTGWTPSTGTDHFATVDENPPNTSDYNTAASTGLTDTFHVENFKNNGADIRALQISLIAQKTDVGPCALQTVIRESGSDSASGTDLYPSTTWAALWQNYSLASADAKRAAAGFNAAEYGVKRTI